MSHSNYIYNKYIELKNQYYENKKQYIIITTPHEKCMTKTNEHHLCDTYAIKLANNIIPNITKKHRSIKVYHGDINRSIIDLNRIISRNTEFRKSISNNVKYYLTNDNANTKNIIIIDCHSFPNDSKSFNNMRIKNPDICILFDKCLDLIYVEELTDLFKENDIIAIKLIGIHNDIIDEFRNYNNVISVLCEVNEGIDNNKLDIIGKVFDIWITKLSSFKIY